MRQILVLYRHPTEMAMRPAIDAHLHALERALRAAGSDDRVVYHNSYAESPSWALRSFEPDAVVLHTTFLCMRWSDHFGRFSWQYEWLRDLPCTKIAIPQDEYDHSEILDEWLYDLRVTDVFTNFDAPRRELIYPMLRDSDIRFHEVLTGYIDEDMATYAAGRMRPTAARRFDIVYRASKLPYWFGAHGQLKHRIADVVERRAAKLRLRSDISTRYEDVIYGDAWTDFLLSGRTVIGAESGSSALDRRGEVQAAFTTMLAAEPLLSFEAAAARLAPGWDGHDLGALSPRHLEAVVTKTCQILVVGRYSDVLEAGAHYLALAPDFTNLDDVLEASRDDVLLKEITERAYEEIYLSGRFTYDVFGAELAAAVAGASSPRPIRHRLNRALLAAEPVEDGLRRSGRRAATAVSRAADPRLLSRRFAVAQRPSLPHPHARRPKPPPVPRPARVGRTLHFARLMRLAAGSAAQSEVRPLLFRYAATRGWRDVPPKPLAQDLLRLGLARRTRTFDELRGDDPANLCWNHAEVGAEAPIAAGDPRFGVVALGDAPYDFPALSALLRRYSRTRRHDKGQQD